MNRLEFRLEDLEKLDWTSLDALADRVPFQRRGWLEYLSSIQGGTPIVASIYDGSSHVGYFTGITVRRLGIKILGSPMPGWTTPYMGFNLLREVTPEKLLDGLQSFAFRRLGCLHLEVSDRRYGEGPPDSLPGFHTGWYESYETDLTRSEDELFAAMTSACRRCVRKAEKSGVSIEHATDAGFAEEFHAQLKDVFAKQSLVPSYGVERVRALIRHLLPTGSLLLLRARDPDGRCIGTGIYPGHGEMGFFWGNASWRAFQGLRPNEALHWHAIRYWKERGAKRFDWGGGGTYKEKYGVRPIRIPHFMRSRVPGLMLLRDHARDWFYRAQGVAGSLTRAPGPPSAEAD